MLLPAHAVRQAYIVACILQEPLLPGAVVGNGKPSGKGLVQDPYRTSSMVQNQPANCNQKHSDSCILACSSKYAFFV
jgi:hypothetical protein